LTTVTLRVTRHYDQKLETQRLTPDIAFRLARVFNSTPEMWLNMQQAVDLWEARAVHGHEYEKIQPVHEALSL